MEDGTICEEAAVEDASCKEDDDGTEDAGAGKHEDSTAAVRTQTRVMEKNDFIFFTLLLLSVTETNNPVAVSHTAVTAQSAS